MNKLKQNLFTKKSWGSEIIWSLTDGYMCKTVEIKKGNETPLVVHELKEKSILVIKGPLYLIHGKFGDDDFAEEELPEGWSWYIDSGISHRYVAKDNPVALLEVSTPYIEDGIVLLEASSKQKRKRRTKK